MASFQTSPSTSSQQTTVPVSSTKSEGEQSLATSQLIDRIKGVIYGNCIGDAIGLLTEFLDKEEAQRVNGVQNFKLNNSLA